MKFRIVPALVLAASAVGEACSYFPSHHTKQLVNETTYAIVKYDEQGSKKEIRAYNIKFDRSYDFRTVSLMSLSEIDRDKNGIPDPDIISAECPGVSQNGFTSAAFGLRYAKITLDRKGMLHIEKNGTCGLPGQDELKELKQDTDKAVLAAIKHGEEIK